MNKAKILISILCIASILGTVFAFKLADKTSSNFIYTGKLHSGSCTTKLDGAAIMGGKANVAAATSSTTKNCPDVFTIAVND